MPDLIRICREAGNNSSEIEFVFVNNGSKDNSSTIFNELLQQPGNQFAKLVDIPVNKGYGYGILQGLYAASGEILSWTHADLQTDPADVIGAFRKYEEKLLTGKYLVKGKRIGRKLFDALFTSGMSTISSVLLSTNLSDVNAQPKMFKKDLMLNLYKAPYDFSLDLYLLYVAKGAGMTILSFPVDFKKRMFGEAKGGGTLKGKINLIKRTLNFIFELRRAIKKGER